MSFSEDQAQGLQRNIGFLSSMGPNVYLEDAASNLYLHVMLPERMLLKRMLPNQRFPEGMLHFNQTVKVAIRKGQLTKKEGSLREKKIVKILLSSPQKKKPYGWVKRKKY